jgi:hypothetical protein
MKKLALIGAVAAMSVILCGSESFAKDGRGGSSGGGRSGGASRGSGGKQATSKGHQSRPGTHRPQPGAHSPHPGMHPAHHPHQPQPAAHHPHPGTHPAHHPHQPHPGHAHHHHKPGGLGLTVDVRPTGRVASGAGVEWAGGRSEGEVAEPNTGMEIRELFAGTARKQGMKVGDIIMAINGNATPDFDSLRSALVDSGSQAEVDFINVDNGELERIILYPAGAMIGATVEQVTVD